MWVCWLCGDGRDGEQLPGPGDIGLVGGAGQQAVMADAMEAFGQHMSEEAADEFVWRQRHDALTLGTIAAIVFVAEGNAGLIHGDQAAVRDGDAVGVAREVSEHGLGPREGGLGIDHPALFTQRRDAPE